MNVYVFVIETIVLIAVFTACIMIPLCKNPVWWIHDYPMDIQEEYFKTHERIPSEKIPCGAFFCRNAGRVDPLPINRSCNSAYDDVRFI